jgi:hypothetical protein
MHVCLLLPGDMSWPVLVTGRVETGSQLGTELTGSEVRYRQAMRDLCRRKGYCLMLSFIICLLVSLAHLEKKHEER